MILNRYVTCYQTKAEQNEAEGFWANLDHSKTKYGKYKSAGLQLLGKRDTGGYEAADKLLGHHFYGSSDHVIWVGADIPSKRGRRLKSKNDLDALNKDSTDLFYENMVETFYKNRPKFLENSSLYEVTSKYEWTQRKPADKDVAEKMKLFNDKGYFHSVKERVVKTPNMQLKMDTTERYYHNLLMLFKPWRDEDKDLLGGCKTFEESFHLCANTLPDMVNFQNVRKKITDAVEIGKRFEEEAEKEAEDGQISNEKVGEKDEPNIEVPLIRDIDETALRTTETQLNTDQRCIYDQVVSAIEKQELHWNLEKPLGFFSKKVGAPC